MTGTTSSLELAGEGLGSMRDRSTNWVVRFLLIVATTASTSFDTITHHGHFVVRAASDHHGDPLEVKSVDLRSRTVVHGMLSLPK